MADDRHEAYRELFTTSELNKLFKKFKDKHSVASITYDLLRLQRAHPDWTMDTVIAETKKYLNGN